MENREAGFCGDYCGKCTNYQVECPGCVPSEHADCYFVRCCQGKGIQHCGLCEDLPCARLKNFVPDDRPECKPGYHIHNLHVRAAIGTEAWLASQRKTWKRSDYKD